MLAGLGVILGLIFLSYSIYRGLSPIVAGILSALLIIVMGGSPIEGSFQTAFESIGMVVANVGAVIVIGGILGILYNSSGAMASFANFMLKPCRSIQDESRRRFSVIVIFLVIRFLIGLSGIDNNAVMVTMTALAVTICKEFDLPNKYIPCLSILSSGLANLIPGTPVALNLLCEQYIEGFNNSKMLILRTLLLIIYIVAAVIYLYWQVEKDKKKGLCYEAGPMNVPELESGRKMPPWFFALIPVAVIYITYNFMNLSAWISVALGTVVAAVFFIPYIVAEEGRSKYDTVMQQIHQGSVVFPLQLMFVILPAQAMTITGGLDAITNGVSAAGVPAIIVLIVVAIVVLGFGGMFSLPVIGGLTGLFFGAGMSPMGVGMVCIWASTVFDTLPNNTAILFNCEMAGTTMKKAYPIIFQTTVTMTLFMTILVAVLAQAGLI